MSKNCIFCDGKEKSKEHIFPSCFGGRLQSKKIYCREHNSELGRYVDVLDEQIGLINNLFGIEPDRGIAKSRKVQDPETGEIYQRNIDGEIKFSPIDNIDIEGVVNGQLIELKISSPEDIQKVQKHFSNQGIEIKEIDRGASSQKLFMNPLRAKVKFGGPLFFKATLYLLITFLAHYRKPTIDDININFIIDILFNDDFDDNKLFQLVSIEGGGPVFLEDDSEELMHSFAFVQDKDRVLYGIVSYFNSVTYTIKIGEVNNFNNFAVYVFPLSKDLDPNRAMVKKDLSQNIDVNFQPNLHKEIIKNILNNSPLEGLFNKLNCFQRKSENKKLLDGIREQSSLSEMMDFWRQNEQLILNRIDTLSNLNIKEKDNILLYFLFVMVELYRVPDFDNNSEFSLKNIELLNLECFIDECCQSLSKYYWEKRSIEHKDVLIRVDEEILYQACEKISLLYKC